MQLYYSDTFELPLPDRHRFPMAKYTLLREGLEQCEISHSLEFHLPPPASDEQLLLVHTPAYLASIKSGELTDLQIRRIGFPWSPKMVERSRRSTGASIAAGRSAIQRGISVNLAGGTHHSFADSGQGYCVFNDVCVAARVLQQEKRIQTALFVDLDVHQGNGTSSIASGDSTLFSFSMHCEKNYPFQKTDGDLDVALPAGTTDQTYLAKLEEALRCIQDRFRPDIVFYLAGADPFEGDRLGLLSVSKTGLRQRDQTVIGYFRDRKVPIAISMAGGYANNHHDIVDIHTTTVLTAAARLRSENQQPRDVCPGRVL